MPKAETRLFPKFDIRSPQTGKLLFKYIPHLDAIEIAQRGIVDVIRLTDYRNPPPAFQTTVDLNQSS